MLSLKETIDVTYTPAKAFNYLADFTHIERWDPSVLTARQVTEGLPQVGTQFRLKLLFGGRPVPMNYRITEMASPRRLVLEGTGTSFRAEDRITLAPLGDGTRIHYEADIVFEAGWGRKLAPLAAPLVRYSGRRAVQQLQQELSGGGPLPRLTLTTRMVDQAILPGLVGFTRLGYRLGKHRWPLPRKALRGRTVVLTGGTSGIGRAAAFQLVRLGADLVLVGRNREKTEQVGRALRTAGGSGKVAGEIADLSLMADTRALAKRIVNRYPAVHVLINNAGALFNPRETTAEGIEKTLATDLLSPFLLTEGLRPALAAGRPARIVNVSSGGMYTRGIDLDNLDSVRGAYNGAEAYARAKRGGSVGLQRYQRACHAPRMGGHSRPAAVAYGISPADARLAAHPRRRRRHHHLAGGRGGSRTDVRPLLAGSSATRHARFSGNPGVRPGRPGAATATGASVRLNSVCAGVCDRFPFFSQTREISGLVAGGYDWPQIGVPLPGHYQLKVSQDALAKTRFAA